MSKYLRNEHYFEVINSEAKSYIVGFIAADGALVKSSTGNSYYLTITIKYEDKAVLEFIKTELGSTHKLMEINRIGGFGNPVHHVRLCLANKYIVHYLNNLGIKPRKSLSMPNIIANIPLQYRDAFIIGYFDGDGSVSHVHNSPNNKSLHIQIRGTKEFLTGIANHLELPDSFIYEHGSIPQLSITSKKYQRRFFNCYHNLPFYYTRKYNKFLGYL